MFSGLIKQTRSRPLDRLQHGSLPRRWTGIGLIHEVRSRLVAAAGVARHHQRAVPGPNWNSQGSWFRTNSESELLGQEVEQDRGQRS